MSEEQQEEILGGWLGFTFYDKSKLDEKTFTEVMEYIKPKNREKDRERTGKETELWSNYTYLASTTWDVGLDPSMIDRDPSIMDNVIHAAERMDRILKENPFCKVARFYSATYFISTGRLKVRTIFCPKNTEEFQYTDPWEIFYDHCTFEEILKVFTSNDSSAGSWEEFPRYRIVRKSKDEKDILELVRDCPQILREKEILFAFIDILETARWSLHKKDADNARNLLVEYLIPKRHGGKVAIPRGLNTIEKIMKALADHLSKKCRHVLGDSWNYERGQKEINENDYNILKEWARKNKEFRISYLSLYDLNTLLLRPSTFVHDLMETYFGASIKTIFRRR